MAGDHVWTRKSIFAELSKHYSVAPTRHTITRGAVIDESLPSNVTLCVMDSSNFRKSPRSSSITLDNAKASQLLDEDSSAPRPILQSTHGRLRTSYVENTAGTSASNSGIWRKLVDFENR